MEHATTHAPAAPARGHLIANAVLDFVNAGILFVVGGLVWIVLALVGDASGRGEAVALLANAFGGLVFVVLAVPAVLYILAGVGLLLHRSWGRTLTLVLTGLSALLAVASLDPVTILLSTPFVAYILWSLLRQDVSDALSRAAVGEVGGDAAAARAEASP